MAKRPKRTKPIDADAVLSVAEQPNELADGTVRVNVRLDADTARWLSMAAAWGRRRPRDVIADGVRLYLKRNPPPGYQDAQAQPAKDLSADAALKLARKLKAERQTHKAIAAELNRQGYRTATGKQWTAINVQQRLRTRR
jgi:hypothetical protein